ncbi:MAG: glycoside hydrolase family 28 protein [Bacteroidota bacterium]
MTKIKYDKLAIAANVLIFILMVSCIGDQEEFNYKNAAKQAEEGWKEVPEILSRIKPPKFPDRTFNILDFGAVGDSATNSLPAVIKAIEACNKAGGGKVLVPAGQYFLDGPIHFQNDVNLHLEQGARIFFSSVPERYLPAVKVRWEGTVCYNYSPLIYAFQKMNIAITGDGEIDGAAQEWSAKWRKVQKPDQKQLRQMGNDTIPVNQRVFANGFLDLNGDGMDDGFGDGKDHYLRPTLIEFYQSENILIEGLTIRNGPFWTIHPVFSKNVTIRNCKVYGDVLNDDGIDPDSCEDVLIEECMIKTHDDAISIKAGRDQDAWNRQGTKNVVIRNNQLLSKVNALCIGSEMSGGVSNIFMENNKISNGEHALNFKCNLDRGGQVQNIYIRNIEVESCRDAMFIFRMDYHGYRGNNFPTKFNDFYVSNITCNRVEKTPFKIVGVEDEPITRILMKDVNINSAGEESIIQNAEDLIFKDVTIGQQEYRYDPK